MNSKAILVPFIAVFAVMFVGLVAAQLTTSLTTQVNDVLLSNSVTTPLAGITGDTIPVNVQFTAIRDASDVRLRVWVEGFRNDVSVSTSRFNLVNGSIYSKILNLELPADIDETTEDITLHVSISNADNFDQASYSVRLQRESYSLNVISVDYPLEVSAGSNIPVSVVVENNGIENLENGFITVSIPSLGISSKGFFGDLVSVENCTDDCNKDDSVQKIVYLQLPDSASAGVYQLSVQVYNKDATTTVAKQISVKESEATNIIPAVKSQDIEAGQTKTYDLIIVNSGDNIKVYNVQAVSGTSLSVSAPSVVTAGPESSVTVPITVTAADDAQPGSYTFSVSVDGKQTSLVANVTAGSVSASIVTLTVVLVIVFIVLLVVLIVLLTRKEKQVEEVETSYY